MSIWPPGLWRETTRSWRSLTWTWLKRSNENDQCTWRRCLSPFPSKHTYFFLHPTKTSSTTLTSSSWSRPGCIKGVEDVRKSLVGSSVDEEQQRPQWTSNSLFSQWTSNRLFYHWTTEWYNNGPNIYVWNRVTFFQSITNNGLTIMSSEKHSLTPIYLCPCDQCHHCIYSDYHLIEQQYNLYHIMCCSGTLSFTVNAIPFQYCCKPSTPKSSSYFLCQVPQCLRRARSWHVGSDCTKWAGEISNFWIWIPIVIFCWWF